MKKQQGIFLAKRDKVRHHLIMTRLGLKNQTYQKIMQQKSNGKINQPFNANEVKTICDNLQVVIDAFKEFQDELNTPD